nr:3'-5' exonuclease [Actinomyces procaprae]
MRDRYQRDNAVTGLAHRGVEVRPVDREAVGRGRPVVMTMHRAKGLEFRKVLLFDVSVEAIPRSLREQEYSEADHDDALLRERSLLYVAATRARDQLAISWSGQASPLLAGVGHASQRLE